MRFGGHYQGGAADEQSARQLRSEVDQLDGSLTIAFGTLLALFGAEHPPTPDVTRRIVSALEGVELLTDPALPAGLESTPVTLTVRGRKSSPDAESVEWDEG